MRMGFIDADSNRLGGHYRCSDNDDHEDGVRCGGCGEWYAEDEVYGNHEGYWCPECAESAYTDILGLRFITEYDAVDEYYDAEDNISLKDFCLYDMGAWVEFLNRKGNKRVSSEYMEGVA